MTTAGQSTDSRTPVPAPGGTWRLAGRAVARIGFGAMQLEGRNADRDTALAVLRQAVGASVNHIDTAQFYGDCNALIRAAPAGIACVQNLYSVIDRTTEPVLDRCRALGVAWVPFFPLGSAIANRARVTDDPTVIAIAAELGATPAQVGLAWLLASYDRTLLIPGTSDPAHLAENIAAGAVRLPSASIAALDRLGASTASESTGQ